MLKWIIGLFTGGPYYLRINRERVSVRNISTDETFECRAVLGIDESGKVASVGDPVSSSAVQQINPFDHPRVLISDYTVAEAIFSHALREISGMRYLRPSPVVLVHPDLELAGGLTPIEARALRELAEGAGARKTFLYYGNISPSDQDLRDVLGGA